MSRRSVARKQHVHEVVERRHGPQVDDVVGGLAAGLRDLLHHLAQLLLAAGDEEDLRAGGGERQGEPLSQPRGRPGQEGDFSVQRLVHDSRKCIIRPRMDTISHGLAGSVFARSFSDRPGARAAFLLGAAAAMVPDLDFLFFSTRLDYLRDHRSWTHSFLVLPFLALGMALAGKAFWRAARLSTLWLFAAIGVASHILFDWITSFGTMFWTPVSRARYSLDWVFILDPLFTGIVLVSLILSLVFRNRQRRIAAAGAGLLCAYIVFCALVHARALAVWKRMDAPPAGRDRRRPAAVPVAVPLARPLRARRRDPRGLLRRRAVRARCGGPEAAEEVDRDPVEPARLLPAARRARRSSASSGRPPRRSSTRRAPFPRSASTWPSRAFRSRRSTRRPTGARRSSCRTCASCRGSPGPGSATARKGSAASPSSTACASTRRYAPSSGASCAAAGADAAART